MVCQLVIYIVITHMEELLTDQWRPETSRSDRDITSMIQFPFLEAMLVSAMYTKLGKILYYPSDELVMHLLGFIHVVLSFGASLLGLLDKYH